MRGPRTQSAEIHRLLIEVNVNKKKKKEKIQIFPVILKPNNYHFFNEYLNCMRSKTFMTLFTVISKYISLHFENISKRSVHSAFRLSTGRSGCVGQTNAEAPGEVYLLKFGYCVMIIASSC